MEYNRTHCIPTNNGSYHRPINGRGHMTYPWTLTLPTGGVFHNKIVATSLHFPNNNFPVTKLMILINTM